MKPRSASVTAERPAGASGTSSFSAWGTERPARTSSSTTASIVAESEAWKSTTGRTAASSSPSSSERIAPSRARIQLRLPVSVLTSPLWATIR